MSVLVTENTNIIEVSTSINSLSASSSSTNNIFTQSNDNNISIINIPNNINISNTILSSSSDIMDFNTAVSGLLPSVMGIDYIVSSFYNNIYTISASGLQPSGNYSIVGHTHISSDITDFSSSVSGLLPVIDIISGSGILVNSSSGIFTISGSGLLTPNSIITYPQLSNDNSENLNIQKRVAKAWINFNGTGVVSIRDDFNISNIIDNGVGDYTINFTIPFSNTNYAFVAWARDFNNDVYVTSGLGAKSNTTKTTSSIRVIFNYLLNGLNYDSSECNLIFFSS